MLQASKAFRKDTSQNNYQISPFLVLGERQDTTGAQNWDKHLFLSGGNLDIIHRSSTYWEEPYPKIPFVPAIKTIPYIQQSFDLFSHNFTSSTVTFELINTEYKKGLLSDVIMKYNKKEIRLYFATPSCLNWAFRPWLNSDPDNQALLSYKGKITEIKHDKHTISIECEDGLIEKLNKKIPLDRNKLDNFNCLEKDKGKYLPIVYGEVPVAPAFITETPMAGEVSNYEIMTENTNHRAGKYLMGSAYIKSDTSYCHIPQTAGAYPFNQIEPQISTTKKKVKITPKYKSQGATNHIPSEKIVVQNARQFLDLSGNSFQFEALWENQDDVQDTFFQYITANDNSDRWFGGYPEWEHEPSVYLTAWVKEQVFGDTETEKIALKTTGSIKDYITKEKNNTYYSVELHDAPIYREDGESLKVGCHRVGSSSGEMSHIKAYSWQFELPFENQINESDVCTPEEINPSVEKDLASEGGVLHHPNQVSHKHIIWTIEGKIKYRWKRDSSATMDGDNIEVLSSWDMWLGLALNVNKKTFNLKKFDNINGHTNGEWWWGEKSFTIIVDSIGFQDEFGYDLFSQEINTSIKIAPMMPEDAPSWLGTIYSNFGANQAFPSDDDYGYGGTFPLWEFKDFKIEKLKIQSHFVSKDFIEKDFYAYTKGRFDVDDILTLDNMDYSSDFNNSLNHNNINDAFKVTWNGSAGKLNMPAATIADLAVSEGMVEKIDALDLKKALNAGYHWGNYNNFRFDFSISGKNRKTVKKHITEMAKATEYLFPIIKRSGSLGFAYYLKHYTDDDYNKNNLFNQDRAQVVFGKDVIKYSFELTDFKNAKKHIRFNYDLDPSENRYQETFTKDYASYSNASSASNHGELYGYTEPEDGTKIINNLYSKDIPSAITVGKDFHHYLLVDLVLPLKYCYLECGDLVRFDELLDNYKPYGENYLLWEEHPDFPTRYSYPLFMINSFKMNDKNVHIKAFRLHQMTTPTSSINDEWDEINQEVDQTVPAFYEPIKPTIYGCTNPNAENYDPMANTDNGTCYFKSGCTHPDADNYDPLADFDNGSCTFENMEIPPPTINMNLNMPAISLNYEGGSSGNVNEVINADDVIINNGNFISNDVRDFLVATNPIRTMIYPWLVHKYYRSYPPAGDYTPASMGENAQHRRDPYDIVIDLSQSYQSNEVEYEGDNFSVNNGITNEQSSYFIQTGGFSVENNDMGIYESQTGSIQSYQDQSANQYCSYAENEDGTLNYSIIRIHMLEIWEDIKNSLANNPNIANLQIPEIQNIEGIGDYMDTESAILKGKLIIVGKVAGAGVESQFSFQMNEIPVPPWIYPDSFNFYDLCAPPRVWKELYSPENDDEIYTTEPLIEYIQLADGSASRVITPNLVNHYLQLLLYDATDPFWDDKYNICYPIMTNIGLQPMPDTLLIQPVKPWSLYNVMNGQLEWISNYIEELHHLINIIYPDNPLPLEGSQTLAEPVQTESFTYGNGVGAIDSSLGLRMLKITWDGDVDFKSITPAGVAFRLKAEGSRDNMLIVVPDDTESFSDLFSYEGNLSIQSVKAYDKNFQYKRIKIVKDSDHIDNIGSTFDKLGTDFNKLKRDTSFGLAKGSTPEGTTQETTSGESGGY